MLISPTEPAQLRAIGTSNLLPETFGADVFFAVRGADDASVKVGIQRKEIKDLVNSVNNDLLGIELNKMKRLDIAILLIEGNFRWTTSGVSLVCPGWSVSEHRALLFSVSSRGYWILQSSNLAETIELSLALEKWMRKPQHSLLRNRTGPKSKWGKANDKDFGIHLLSSFPGVNYTIAERIWEKFGGVPLKWDCELEELLEVDGIGEHKLRSLWEGVGRRDEKVD